MPCISCRTACTKGLIFFNHETLLWLQILRDPSGNSFVENVCAPATDPQREVTSFARTRDEAPALEIYTQEEIRQREMEGEEERVRTWNLKVNGYYILHVTLYCTWLEFRKKKVE